MYHFGGSAVHTCRDLCGRQCATVVAMGICKCWIGSDHVFQAPRACSVCTDA